MLNRRKMMLAAKLDPVSGLPSGYTRVNCLIGTGAQHIDTGVYLTKDHAVSIEVSVDNTMANNNIFGSRQSATQANFSVACNRTYLTADFWDYSINRYQCKLENKRKIKLSMDKTAFRLDGVTVQNMNDVDEFTTPTSALLFQVGGNPYTTTKMSGSVYSLSIQKNGILILDFIPCVRDSDGKPGMYDVITNDFFTNAGTGEFEWGDI